MTIRVPAALLAAVALFGCNSEPQAQAVPAAAPESASPTGAPSGLPVVPLRIKSGGRTHNFNVEVAQTPEEQAQGLMFRKRVAPN